MLHWNLNICTFYSYLLPRVPPRSPGNGVEEPGAGEPAGGAGAAPGEQPAGAAAVPQQPALAAGAAGLQDLGADGAAQRLGQDLREQQQQQRRHRLQQQLGGDAAPSPNRQPSPAEEN